MSSPPPLLKTIRSLKDSTFEACATTSAHLKAFTSASSEPEAKLRRNYLKPLVVELRLLGGALYSLESLIVELSDNDTSHDSTLGIRPSLEREWPLIERCEMLIQMLNSFPESTTSDGIKAARSSLLDIRSKLAFVLGSSDSLEDISLQFSILEPEPMPQLMIQKEDDPETGESPAQNDDEYEPLPEEVSAWLTILNSPENDREPAEYNKEAALVHSRHIKEPKYRVASTRWPDFAEKYWYKLRPQVCSLFRPSTSGDGFKKSYNFVQWVLEYARETYPRTLGPLALSPRLLLELTDALCDGSISSLHIAASLRLPNLCKDLISMGMGANINQSSLIGPPLFCALVGSKVLMTRSEPQSWTTLLGNDLAPEGDSLLGGDSADQAATILLLIDNGADCSYRYAWKNATEEVSLAGLAFWTAMKSKNDSIFTQIVKGGGILDHSFSHLLRREALFRRGLLHRARFARLLTYVYDLTLVDIERGGEEYHNLQDLVSRLMNSANVTFSPSAGGKVETLSDSSFSDAIRTAVLDFNPPLVARLTKDSRFNPNFLYDRQGSTILHMAAEAAQTEIIDLLIGAGADIRARDFEGRTPLMTVEDISPLAKLILEHSAPTYDTDHGGRNIWHLFAATNDVELLKFLWEHDPYKIRNLDAVCEDGHTPLKAAFAYVEDLKFTPKGSRGTGPTAARFLLEKCQGHLRAEGNEGLAQWAVEWGNLPLLQRLFQLLPRANVNDEELLRSLNMSACPKLVSLVLGKSGPSRQFSDGTTAAETVITNVKLMDNRIMFSKPSAHPSCFPNMTRSAYLSLLTPEVLKSRDSRGRGLWVRFCEDVIPLLNGPSAEHPSNIYFLSAFICMAISCLVEKGALVDYEMETGKWSLGCMTKKGHHLGQPFWECWHFPFITAILEEWLEPSPSSPKPRLSPQASLSSPNTLLSSPNPLPPSSRRKSGSKDFFNELAAALLLFQAVTYRQTKLVHQLVQCGVSVHRPWRGALSGKSVFESFLADPPVDIAMIRPLLSNTKRQDLIEQQYYTFAELMRLSDEAVAVEVLDQLIDCGMDMNNLHVTPPSLSRSPLLAPTPSMLVMAICSAKLDVARLMIQRGADAALAPGTCINAFMVASKLGYVVVLENIIEKAPSDFDWLCLYEHFEDGDTYNALQFAAAGGHRDALTTLLEATPLEYEIDTVSPKFGRSPVHLAAKAGSLDCIKILTQYKADLNIKDSAGRTPLFLALIGGDRDLIEYMKEHLLDPGNGQDLGISLLEPVSKKSFDSKMTDESFDKESPGHMDSEPKQLGAMIADAIDRYQLNSDALFESFLDHTSKEDLESAIMPCGGCTLLSYAAAGQKIRPMVELLDLGFKGFVTGCREHWRSGFNALFNACRDIRSLMIFDTFISREKAYSFFKKCLDAYLGEGMLWFHLPVSPIQALFHNSQVLDRSSIEHQSTVLQVFIDHLTEHAETYWVLMRRSGLITGFEFSEDETVVKRVLRFALNLQSQPTDETAGTTALHDLMHCFATEARRGFTTTCVPAYCRVAQLLIENGSDVNTLDGQHSTALHLSTYSGSLAMVKTLLKAGADPNILDGQGISPLALSISHGDFRLARFLLQHGASPVTFQSVPFERFGGDVEALHELLELGLDPYDTFPGRTSTLADAISLWPSWRTSYVLNGNFDFYRLVEQEPNFLSKALDEIAYPSTEFKMILRRIPHEHRARIVDFELQDSISPGCLAIKADSAEILNLLLDAGLDIEREWHGKGSKLMFAASLGSFNCFKVLVRRGARLSYLGIGRRGEVIARSVVEAAKCHPKLLQWLFSGRYYEAKYLTQTEHCGTFTATKPWSGPRKAMYRMTGTEEEYPKLPGEAMIDFVRRVAGMKRNLIGRMIPVTLVELDG
ncbi:hypothetical protein F53441_5457 [Fusarium austroafricanum]|uniref:Ankyrin repeat protein n=1 Tax=Fusarium austroafricanum TaxID=2364996 RepID=A0A8H4KKS0_9HYPO|nr:hypothetical protein F53441_5457 [Fusarium austroafricanum]